MPRHRASRTTVLIGATACVGACLALAWFAGAQVPEMRSPIRITQAFAYSDGGSTWVAMEDATGRRIAFGVRATLGQAPADWSVQVQRWYPEMPLPVPLARGSSGRRALLGLLEQAAHDNANEAQGMLGAMRETLAARPD